MTTEIVEIIGRSEQGVTRPFICRGSDGNIYFVKGRGAGRRSLICEWVAGHLGLKLGLPIVPFSIVDIPPALVEFASRDDLSELGVGPAFGSSGRSLVELTISHVTQIDDNLQCDVLAFDWWVKNGDRTQTSTGGNPNLFWDVNGGELLVLDHNQAFDPDFDDQKFIELHPFHRMYSVVFLDLFNRAEYADRFEKAMADFDGICDTIPDEWWYLDEEMTNPLDFNREIMRDQLLGFRKDDFWSLK